MAIVQTGTVNFRGDNRSGSENYFNLEDGIYEKVTYNWDSDIHQSFTESDVWITDEVGNELIVSNQGRWNAYGYKDVKIDVDAEYLEQTSAILVNNFVDAEIDIGSVAEQKTFLDVVGAKRAHIETEGGDDVIWITTNSNAATNEWANLFDISTGDGQDTVLFKGGLKTEWADFEVDTGASDDFINFEALECAAKDTQIRTIDGGAGTDIVEMGKCTVVTFTNVEVIKGDSDFALSYEQFKDDAIAVQKDASGNFEDGTYVEGEWLVLVDVGFTGGEFTSVELDADAEYYLNGIVHDHHDLGIDVSEYSLYTNSDGVEFIALSPEDVAPV